jgi:hypothetical protein
VSATTLGVTAVVVDVVDVLVVVDVVSSAFAAVTDTAIIQATAAATQEFDRFIECAAPSSRIVPD